MAVRVINKFVAQGILTNFSKTKVLSIALCSHNKVFLLQRTKAICNFGIKSFPDQKTLCRGGCIVRQPFNLLRRPTYNNDLITFPINTKHLTGTQLRQIDIALM